MGLNEQIFSTSDTDPDGQGPALNYEDVIVVLPSGADPERFNRQYYVLAGVVPADPDGHAERYCCRDGIRFMACTSDPNCNGGPVPKASLKRSLVALGKRMKRALAALGARVKRALGAPGIAAKSPAGASGVTARFLPAPGNCTILLKRTVTWSTDRPWPCLCDPRSEMRMPVCASTAGASLPGQLKDCWAATGLQADSVAFHVYEISLPPDLKSPPNTANSTPSQLIAVPVLYGGVSAQAIASSLVAAVR